MRGEVVSPNQSNFLLTDSTLAPARTGLPRAVEVVLSLLGLIVSAPLIALSAAAIAATSSGSVIFRQERVGRGGRTFVLYKLRTMRPGLNGPQVTAGDDVRVTWMGRLLRRAKLDELPELWNVLKGDMSLVGPRPEVPRYVDMQNPLWKIVLEARPGITDPVTLSLRNEETLLSRVNGNREDFYLRTLQPYKLEGYVAYLSERSFWRDVKILCQTFRAVVAPNTVLPPTTKPTE